MTMVVGEAEEGQRRNAGCCCCSLAVGLGVFFLLGALMALLSIYCWCCCCHNCSWTKRCLRTPALKGRGGGVGIQPAASWRQRAILVVVPVAFVLLLALRLWK